MSSTSILQYWGWAKYQYRQVDKNTFQQAKDAALEALNSCPVKVIQQFINCSWWWMSAYHMGLTGDAAQWAVWKQKGHHHQQNVGILVWPGKLDNVCLRWPGQI